MKAPSLSTSPSFLYSRYSPHFLAPVFSMSTNFLRLPLHHHHHPFSSHKPINLSSFTMATCIHSSPTTTDTPSHPNNIDDVLYNNYVDYCRRTNLAHHQAHQPHPDKDSPIFGNNNRVVVADLWLTMKDEARSDVDQEPILSTYYSTSILSHNSMENALANYLSLKLSNPSLPVCTLYDLFSGVLLSNDGEEIMVAVHDDLRAVKERDPACISYVHCFLNFKGFLACQAHRIAHHLWSKGRKILALTVQNRVSEVFAVDIHPGAKIGRGILLDHATGLVIGETAVIGNNVSILHNVTLGGTGKESGDRHPKIGDGVLIGAGTCVLGNVVIEDGAKIGAGSVVLKRVPARTTAVGNPAKLIGGKANPVRLDKMPSLTMDHTSHISEWSDYVI